jgi:hypothetical protein
VFDSAGTYWEGLNNIADRVRVVAFETMGLISTLLVLLYCVAASRYAEEISNLLQSLTREPLTEPPHE